MHPNTFISAEFKLFLLLVLSKMVFKLVSSRNSKHFTAFFFFKYNYLKRYNTMPFTFVDWRADIYLCAIYAARESWDISWAVRYTNLNGIVDVQRSWNMNSTNDQLSKWNCLKHKYSLSFWSDLVNVKQPVS